MGNYFNKLRWKDEITPGKRRNNEMRHANWRKTSAKRRKNAMWNNAIQTLIFLSFSTGVFTLFRIFALRYFVFSLFHLAFFRYFVFSPCHNAKQNDEKTKNAMQKDQITLRRQGKRWNNERTPRKKTK